MPFFNKTRTINEYVPSMANLRQIGLALWMYAEDNNDVFPENLEQTEKYAQSPGIHSLPLPEIYSSPLRPVDFNGPSYIYISGHSFQDAKAQVKCIIVYENPEYLSGYEKEMIPVLYLEGSTVILEKEKFLSELKKTYEHLGKPVPEIKFKEK